MMRLWLAMCLVIVCVYCAVGQEENDGLCLGNFNAEWEWTNETGDAECYYRDENQTELRKKLMLWNILQTRLNLQTTLEKLETLFWDICENGLHRTELDECESRVGDGEIINPWDLKEDLTDCALDLQEVLSGFRENVTAAGVSK
eukprot:TRINITY_DN4471_c0_g1_i1.p1 TRINITY_DN4471_c0_g1~~TRINITY_DN4471_c0_g1_i1.p1  ORF type:complete len:145 (+),score=17.68 TRINITY_DN4471_c0_g1_i1:40-474(+)